MVMLLCFANEQIGFHIYLSTTISCSLGLAYANSHREDVQALLLPLVLDKTVKLEIASLAALSLGLISVGDCNGDISSAIVQAMMERDKGQLKDTWGRFLGLGLALLYLGE